MISKENHQSASGRGNPSTSSLNGNNDLRMMHPENTVATHIGPGNAQAQAVSQEEYRILLPRFPPAALCLNSVFLHADLTGRPYRAMDFRDGLKDVIDLSEVLSLGQFQMSHFWMATMANPAAAEKLKAVKELKVKGKKCLIIDPNSKDVKIKLLWLPLHLDEKKVAEALAPFGTVRSVAREKWRVPGMENMETMNREVCMTLHDTATSESIPHLLKVAGSQTLVVMSGRPPLCLRCKRVVHIRRQCRTPKCARCNRYGHQSDECYSSYASILRGPGAEADSNSELLMDISEVVDASGDILPTQGVTAEHTPSSPNECQASAEKNIEPPQIGVATEGEAPSTQECNDERTPQPSEAPRQSADPAGKPTDYDNEDDPEATMDTTLSTSKDTNESKRKKEVPPDTIASKRKTSLAR
ncbi:hypothetical protein ISCGN_003972 [Ixodes scapularis]